MISRITPQFSAILFLVSFASVGAVCIAPALPEIANVFDSTEGISQQLVAWFLVGYAISQLIYGPLGDLFGHKRTLLYAVVASIVFSVLCFSTLVIPSISLFIVLRFCLGFMMGVGLKMAFYYNATFYSGPELRKRNAYLMCSAAIGTSLSIALTGWLVELLGWTGALYFQLVYCIIGLLIVLTLPKDPTQNHASKEKTPIWRFYWQCLTNPIIFFSSLAVGLGTSFVYVFASEAPFIAIDILKISSGLYGILNLSTSLGLLLGGYLGALLAHQVSKLFSQLLGATLMMMASLLMLITFMLGYISLFFLFFSGSFALVGMAIYSSNSASHAMNEPMNKSYISSTMNFLNMSLAVAAVQILSFVSPSNPLVMPVILVIASLLSCLLVWVVVKAQKARI